MNIDMEMYIARRKSFQRNMEPGDVAIFQSAPSLIRSNDVHHRFRQDSDFYYLTGFGEEQSALVLTKENAILYLRKRDPERETWNGPMLGVDRAVEALAVDEARDITDFKKDIPDLLRKKDRLYYMYGRNPELDLLIMSTCDQLMRRGRTGEFGPGQILHAASLLHEMRMIKSQEEIELLRECAQIASDAHIALMRSAKAGMHEYELEGIILDSFRRHNAVEGYPSIVASGKNACVLHHIENNRRIESNDLILVDAGAEKHCLNSDVTRTFPVADRFNGPQKDAYEIVLAAQLRAIEKTIPGATLDEIHNAAVRDLTQGLIDLGVLFGTLDENVENKKYIRYYMHRTGHWLGMDVHDVGSYVKDGVPRKLEDGMVCTVEPGLYFPDDEQTPPAFRGIGIRIEDDVVVRGNNPLVLSEMIPKTISAIETLRGGIHAERV
jgi:Xaa-Pro aminopeptidase